MDASLQLLRDIPLQEHFDIEHIAQRTDGLSGSDLKELCRNAASVPVREQMKKLHAVHRLDDVADASKAEVHSARLISA